MLLNSGSLSMINGGELNGMESTMYQPDDDEDLEEDEGEEPDS